MNIPQLIDAYLTDPDSSYHDCRYRTRETYRCFLRRIGKDCTSELAEINARQLLRLHEAWTADSGVAMAHGLVGMLRTICTFGATLLENEDCRRLKTILHDMRFAMPGARKERMTVEQAYAIRRAAHARGGHSVALAQAVQFECILRQKDVIGEWVPQSEPGISDVTQDDSKWLRGIRWSEIDDRWILRHMTSKRGKDIEVNLMQAPMVVEELRIMAGLMPGDELARSDFPWSRPLVIDEATTLPFDNYRFRRLWRSIAREAGVPDAVYNMDSRAGAISEAIEAGAPIQSVKQAATHSNQSMTERYIRSQGTDEVQQKRAAHRTKAA